MLIVFELGLSRVPNSMVSTTSRMEGSGGKMYSFWAMNSLRMSFWRVPARSRRDTPRFSAAGVYIAQKEAGGGVGRIAGGVVDAADGPAGGGNEGARALGRTSARLGAVRRALLALPG